MTVELANSIRRFNDFSFEMVVVVFILSVGLPSDKSCLATFPLRPSMRAGIDSPDSLSELREDIDAGISGEMGVDDFERLARRAMNLAEGEADQGELLSILGQTSRLCWSGPAEQSRVLRARGHVRIAEKMSFRGGSDQSATIMVKFEDAIGGALTFELNDDNKIISSNVFIKKELAAFVDKTTAPIFELK